MTVHTAVTVAGVVLAVNAAVVAALAVAAWVGRRRERRFDAHAAEAIELADDTDVAADEPADPSDLSWNPSDERIYRKITRWNRENK